MKERTTGEGMGLTRRTFLGQGAVGAAALGLAGETALAASRGGTPAEENPWRYDVERLRRVDPSLVQFERVAGFAAPGPQARRMALGPDGRVYLGVGRSVIVCSESGERLGSVDAGETVRAILVRADGSLLVGLRDRVQVHDAKGKRVATWSRFAGKPFVTAVAVLGGDVFVADSGNRVVYRCDADGRVRLRLGEKNSDRNIPGLVLPSPFLDLEAGGDGLLRVNNPGRHKVEVYTAEGDLEQSWGRPGVGIESFCGCCNPVALALLSDGRYVTAEKGLPRVKVYGAGGEFEGVVAGPDQFASVATEDRGERSTVDTLHDGLDVAVDPTGRVWVLDLVGNTVQVFRRKAAEGKPA